MSRVRGARRVGLVALVALLLAGSLSGARSDVASGQVSGSISGIVRPGAGSDVNVAGLPVQLIEVRDTPTMVQETRTTAGRFRFDIPAITPSTTYLVRVLVDEVTYLSPRAVQLTTQRPTAQVELTVFGAGSERPALRASIAAVTIVAVDRAAGQMTLQREDVVVNPSTKAWRGDAEGVSVLLPLPDGLISAEGQAWYDGVPAAGEFTPRMDGVAAVVPLRPGETLLMTRFTVAADLTAPVEVRLAAALPTEQLQIMAPQRFVRRVTPLADAVRGEPVTIEEEKMTVVERLRPAEPGEAVAARLFGLAAPIPPHPLSSSWSALVGAGAAALLISVSAFVALRRGQRGAATALA